LSPVAAFGAIRDHGFDDQCCSAASNALRRSAPHLVVTVVPPSYARSPTRHRPTRRRPLLVDAPSAWLPATDRRPGTPPTNGRPSRGGSLPIPTGPRLQPGDARVRRIAPPPPPPNHCRRRS